MPTRPLLVALAFVFACFSTARPVSAARFRWEIKAGTDAEATLVHSTKRSTVSDLCKIDRPTHIGASTERVAPVEQMIYTVRGLLLLYRLEEDGDYHVVIQDTSDESTMVTEIPDPELVGASPWKDQIAAARSAFDARFHPTSSRGNGNLLHVEITGVGFFDRRREGEGAAVNGIELHPILAIKFTP